MAKSLIDVISGIITGKKDFNIITEDEYIKNYGQNQYNKVIEEKNNIPNTTNKTEYWGGLMPDKTQENVETQVSGIGQSDLFKYIEEQQKKQWEREDLIRKETQEREDTAYQRAVADMVKAGINPNLMNVQPSTSGGGITSATGLDYSVITKEMEEQLQLLEQEINNAFKEDENSKDRFNDIFGKFIQMLITQMILGK